MMKQESKLIYSITSKNYIGKWHINFKFSISRYRCYL
uniref:Uncharacterized protein n=1 Tax=Rhizophora mucronata TaxID=61149 RepID=A0A2P2NDY6_RHIMU